MYTGQLVRLREYRKSDIIQAQKFFNDPDIRLNLAVGIPFPVTLDDEEKFISSITSHKPEYSFAIETIADSKYIGGCGVNSVDWKSRHAEVGIFIGDKDYLGKGYGTDAMQVFLRFIFEQMNMNKVRLSAFSFNKRAIRSYEKCGFKHEGVLRQEIFVNGRYFDRIAMGILRDEYDQLYSDSPFGD